MNKSLLLEVTVCRKEDGVVYSINRSNKLTNEELEYYLQQILDGICKWKPQICEEKVHSCTGKIRKRKATKKSGA